VAALFAALRSWARRALPRPCFCPFLAAHPRPESPPGE